VTRLGAACALLLFVSQVDRPTRYDVIERNVVVDCEGREVLRQWIAWDWASIDGEHRCQWWTLDRGQAIQRTEDGWQVTVDGKRIWARWYRETRTSDDPELLDRAKWPVEQRRKPK